MTEVVTGIYDYEYFHNKTPFRAILKRYCNLEIDSYRTGSYSYGSAIQHYDISYDMLLFMKNIKEIKQSLLHTKLCKCLDDVKNKIENISENIEDYENAFAIGRVVSNLIIEWCIKPTASSCRYNWNIKNRYSENMDFNIFCAKKMKKPVIRLLEVNGWERDAWNFYFDFPVIDSQMIVLQELSERVRKMEKVQQCNGQSYFEIMFVPKEFDSINWNICHGYMNKNNFVKGCINVKKVKELLSNTDNYIFEYLYKGGISKLFE